MVQPISPIIVALDTTNLAEAEAWAEALSPHVAGLKVGLEILNRIGIAEVCRAFKNHKLFVDVKLHDIPNTVAGACRALAAHGVWMINVHATGGREMMRAAKQALVEGSVASGKARPILIAVTVLTSLDENQLHEIGLKAENKSVTEWVVHLAKLAQEAGCDGVVASAKEVLAIRQACGKNFLIVTPGIRPVWAPANDQHRVMTPKEAIEAGSDYLVIGRPITSPPAEVNTPLEAVHRINKEIWDAHL